MGKNLSCGEEYTRRWSERAGLVAILVWVLLFVAGLYFVGFDVAAFVCITLFVKIYGRRGWVKSFLLGIGMVSLVYGLFYMAMGLRVFDGVWFGGAI